MRIQLLGWTGERLPLIGQGTWMLDGHHRGKAIAALRAGIEAGMTLIDTAEMYNTEDLVGEAIAGIREQVFLVSKVLPSNASYDGTRRACERSLKRLGVEQIDVYLLHWPGSHPIGETMRGLESLVDQEQVRYIGVSNFDVRDLEGALRSLRNHRLACNQVLYHLGDRGIERRLIPFCEKEGIGVMGYSPFGHDDFPSPRSAGGRVLGEIAERHHGTPRQVVLAFLTRNGVYAIPKAGSEAHARENARLLELSAEELAAVDETFPAPQRDVPLGII